METAWELLAAKVDRWTAHRRRRINRRLKAINALEPILQAESDSQLRQRSLALRYRAQVNEPAQHYLVEAYALVREAARRTLGLRHYAEQIRGALALAGGGAIEMQTGEGKTLAATMPLYLFALAGKGAHLATANDYLARRDAEMMRPLLEFLALSVGLIEAATSAAEARRLAYQCDITYGTAKEFGFDFLRDRLLARYQRESSPRQKAGDGYVAGDGEKTAPMQRGQFFLLVDEVDSLLLDDAGTPLIISANSALSEQRVASCRFCAAKAARFLRDEHFDVDDHRRALELTPAGRALLRSIKAPRALAAVPMETIYRDLECALTAKHFFLRDYQYLVREHKVEIVDEFTGRISEGRKWRQGLHQAIEAQENLPITVPTQAAARITVQELALRYRHRAGMSGTVMSAEREFRNIYRMRASTVPTHRPVIREQYPVLVFATAAEKWTAIVDEVLEMHQQGRPVLIGTRSIEASERLAGRLADAELPHCVLNAAKIAAEAEIVALAGQRGRITISTNMAGRGTDIQLGSGVASLGGLHIICTEMHQSARIDLQLIGRCARQGDPGSFRQFLSLDDEILLRGLGAEAVAELHLRRAAGTLGNLHSLLMLFRAAQRKAEQMSNASRRELLGRERQLGKDRQRMGFDPLLDVSD